MGTLDLARLTGWLWRCAINAALFLRLKVRKGGGLLQLALCPSNPRRLQEIIDFFVSGALQHSALFAGREFLKVSRHFGAYVLFRGEFVRYFYKTFPDQLIGYFKSDDFGQ